jgi:hypothetical protein
MAFSDPAGQPGTNGLERGFLAGPQAQEEVVPCFARGFLQQLQLAVSAYSIGEAIELGELALSFDIDTDFGVGQGDDHELTRVAGVEMRPTGGEVGLAVRTEFELDVFGGGTCR